MNPQHSSPTERSRCTGTPFRSRTKSECMYIHYKVPILYDFRIRVHGSMYPSCMRSLRGEVPSNRILYPPGEISHIPASSPPTVGVYDSETTSCQPFGAQFMHSLSLPWSINPPDKGLCTYAFLDSPDPPQLFNLIQSNRKNRPFFNPFRGRSDRQGGRTGNNHRRYQTCQ